MWRNSFRGIIATVDASSVVTMCSVSSVIYEAAIHLRTPTLEMGYNKDNPLRIESAKEAEAIDARITHLWEDHPQRFFVEPSLGFLDKADRVLEILRGQMPECCRRHVVPLLVDRHHSVPVTRRSS